MGCLVTMLSDGLPEIHPMKTAFHLSAFLVLCVANIALSAEKFSLRPHWETGKVYSLENDTQMTMAVPGLGQASGAGNETKIQQTMTVTVKPEAATGNKMAEIKFASIKADMAMMGAKMTYDSTDPSKSAPFLQQSFGAMVNKSFTMVFDKDDKFLEARGLDTLNEGTPLGKTKAMSGKQMAEMFRKSFEMSLPKEPIAAGESWDFEEKIEMGPVGSIGIKVKGKFDTVVEREGRKHAKLLLEGVFSSPEAADGKKQMVQFGAGSKFTGEIYFDLDRRVAAFSETHSDLKLGVGGQEMPLKQTTTNKVVSIEDIK